LLAVARASERKREKEITTADAAKPAAGVETMRTSSSGPRCAASTASRSKSTRFGREEIHLIA
jgi:hypothetical protein